MDIALLNVRVTFQKQNVQKDTIGNHKNVWFDFYSCYAIASGEGGSEKSESGLIVEDFDISFTVRYCNALSDIVSIKCRISFDGTEVAEMFHLSKSAKNTDFDGFLLHTLCTADKVLRYGENNQFEFSELLWLFSVAKSALSIYTLLFLMLRNRTSVCTLEF